MKTTNNNRNEKFKEIKAILSLYPDLDRVERLFMVVDTLETRALRTDDHTKRASIVEYGKAFEPLFASGPFDWIVIQILRLISQLRRDTRHPHIRPYVRPYVEILANGIEVVRNYLEILAGREAIRKPNERLEKLVIGGRQAIKKNNELANVRRVRRECEQYRLELEQKQQDANNRRRRGRRP